MRTACAIPAVLATGWHQRLLEPRRLAGRLLRLLLMAGWLGAGPVLAAEPPPSRLAVLAMDSALAGPADQLTVALSRAPGVITLERSHIEQVLAEKSLTLSQAGARQQIGQLLAADGLVFLERDAAGGVRRLLVRLVSVTAGVIVAEQTYPWPEQGAVEWSQLACQKLLPLLPKLKLTASQAIPLSVLNFRAAIEFPGGRELESRLTWWVTRRLVQQPELLVLERSRLDRVAEESVLGAADTQFWAGRYTLEGTINRDGVDPAKTTVDIEFRAPRRPAQTFRVVGSPDRLFELGEQVVAQVISALALAAKGGGWEPAGEALTYFEEARWAMRWKLLPEAQRASEASWALGGRFPGLALLRLQSYLDPAAKLDFPLERGAIDPLADPVKGSVLMATTYRAGELALEQLSSPAPGGTLEPAVREACLTALEYASSVLWRQRLLLPQWGSPSGETLRLRTLTRELADRLGEWGEDWKSKDPPRLAQLIVKFAGMWEEDQAAEIRRLEQLVERGGFHALLEQPVHGYNPRPLGLVWKFPEQAVHRERFVLWAESLARAPHLRLAEAGHYWLLCQAVSDYEHEIRLHAALAFFTREREAMITGELSPVLWQLATQHYASVAVRFRSLDPALKDRMRDFEAMLAADAPRRQRAQVLADLTWKLQRRAAGQSIADTHSVESLIKQLQLQPEEVRTFDPLLQAWERQSGPFKSSLAGIRETFDRVLGVPPPPPVPEPVIPSIPIVVTHKPALSPSLTNPAVSAAGLLLLPPHFVPADILYWQVFGHEFGTNVLWVDAYVQMRGFGGERRRSIWRCDLSTGERSEVLLPAVAAGDLPAGKAIACHQGKLLLNTREQLWRWAEDLRVWQPTGLVLPLDCVLSEVGGRLVASSPTSVLGIDLAARSVAILASTRRRPALNPLDELATLGTPRLFSGPNHQTLRLQLGRRLYGYDWAAQAWSEVGEFPDLGEWVLTPGRGGVSYRKPAMQGLAVIGATWDDDKPRSWLTLSGIDEIYWNGNRREKARWRVPGAVLQQFSATMVYPDFAALITDTALWDGRFWVLFGSLQSGLSEDSRTRRLVARRPVALACYDRTTNPQPAWVQLDLPTTPDLARALMARPGGSGLDLGLVVREEGILITSFNLPAVWSFPHAQLASRMAPYQPTDWEQRSPLNDLRERLAREAALLKRFDANGDGKLDAEEGKRMVRDPASQAEALKIKALRERAIQP